MAYVFSLFIFAPLLIYIVPVLRGQQYETRAARFFFAQRQISATAFANSAVAYGFQIASVSVFFGWGFEFGLSALINPLFWGFGILWFLSCLPKYSFFLGKAQTLHGLLGETYQKPLLAKFAAVMTIIGFVGAFTAELAWGSTIVTLIGDSPYFIAAITTVMALCALFYVVWAGQESIIAADQYRLVVAHTGFAVLLIFLISLLHWQGPTSQTVGIILSILTILLFGTVVWTTSRQIKNSAPDEAISLGVRCTKFIRLIMVACLIVSLANLLVFGFHVNTSATTLSEVSLFNFGQGPVDLLSLALLPLCWQFIDFTMWQRLSGVRVETDADHAKIRFSIFRYALETPISWIFALAAGIALRYGAIPIDSESVQAGISLIPIAIAHANTHLGMTIDTIVVGLFGAGVVAAMLSTVDTFVIAATSAFVYDLTPSLTKDRSPSENQDAANDPVFDGKLIALALILVGLLSYWVATYFSFDLVSLLFGAYSAQLSLLPSVIGALYFPKRGPSGTVAITSLALGALGGMAATMIALSNGSWALYPPLFSLGISIPVYFIGWAIERKLEI